MLKGIETQTMITRTTDFVRDADAQQRKNELARDFQAVQTQALAEHEQKFVTNTLRSQESILHRDKQEKGKKSRNQQEGGELSPEDIPEDATPVEIDATHVEMGNYLINIRI